MRCPAAMIAISVRAGKAGGARDTAIMAWVAHWFGPESWPGTRLGIPPWRRTERPNGWVRYEFAAPMQAQRFRATWCGRRQP
jgi:hypothetical protein